MNHRLNRSDGSGAAVLSLDVGTSGVRVALFADSGDCIEGAQVATRREPGDFVELDPELLVQEVIGAVDELFALPAARAAVVEAIAISAFWHSLVGVAEDGGAVTPLLTWADTRAVQAAKELRAEFDERVVHARTGCRFHPSYWPAKLRWLQRERPEQFTATRLWVGFAEYLCLRLFGEPVASVSMASATGVFDQRACSWDKQLLESLGIEDQVPQINTDAAARLTDEFSTRWPSLAEARLVTVVGDGAANNIGGGCSTKEHVALMIGTSGAMRVVFAGEPPPQLSPALWSYRVSRERVVVGGALSDGGGLLRWLGQKLYIDPREASVQQQLAALEPDAHGLTILPFWSGERSTGWHAEARGGIFGLRQNTTNLEIMRAALESIAYRFALIAQALDEIAPAAAIVATGQALRSSSVWLQIIADVLGRPILLDSAPEASSRGAALLALEAVGKIANIEAVPISVDEVFEPDMRRHARYREGLARQQELYERLIG